MSYNDQGDLENQLSHDIVKLSEHLKELKAEFGCLTQNFISKDNFQKELNGAIDEACESYGNIRESRVLHKIWNGLDISSSKLGELDRDFFTMMMLNDAISWYEPSFYDIAIPYISMTWLYGLTAFVIQVVLGGILIWDQMDDTYFGTQMSIPIKALHGIRIVQVFTIFLSAMSQTDLLLGLRTILLLPLHDRDHWNEFLGNKNKKHKGTRTWIWHIFFPNMLKMVQGSLVLTATFVVIIQSDDVVDLLKDFSALYVVSNADDIFFNMAYNGYFGRELYDKATFVKQHKFDEKNEQHKLYLPLSLFIICLMLLSGWIYVTIGQQNGHYVKQKFPLCPFEEIFQGQSYLSIIGDDTCQFKKGEGTNILNCGWDGEDCVILNQRYPNCNATDISLLGDGKCDFGEYNTIECGFDNGDCVVNNKKIRELYPLCPIDNLKNGKTFLSFIADGKCNFKIGEGTNILECGWDGDDCARFNDKYRECIVHDMLLLGDGICDFGDYNSNECGFDDGDCIEHNENMAIKYPDCEHSSLIGDGICHGGHYLSDLCGMEEGDCADCQVPNVSILGNGICDGGEYFTPECGFDGGDCKNCNASETHRVGDGVCDGGEYLTSECGFDGGDCIGCNVDNPSLLGDGFCNGGNYFTQECGFDGRDCENCDVENPSWVGDGFCDEGVYNTEDCSYDGGDCVHSITHVGNVYENRPKWRGGVIASNGFVYGIPSSATKMLKFNPITESSILVGNSLGGEKEKWVDGVLGLDGFIYGVPGDADSILRFDPVSETTSLIGKGHNLLLPMKKFSGGVVVPDGHIYFLPSDETKVVKFNPSNLTDPLSVLNTNNIQIKGKSIIGGVVGKDGNVYGIPNDGRRVLKITVSNDTVSFIGDEYPGKQKWRSGILAKDGNIYACPTDSNQILKIDVTTQRTSLVGPNLGNAPKKWSNFVEGPDGFLYGIPWSSDKILQFDPSRKITTMIDMNIKSVSTPEKNGPQPTRWSSAVLASNNVVYGIPNAEKQILAFTPILYKKKRSPS